MYASQAHPGDPVQPWNATWKRWKSLLEMCKSESAICGPPRGRQTSHSRDRRTEQEDGFHAGQINTESQEMFQSRIKDQIPTRNPQNIPPIYLELSRDVGKRRYFRKRNIGHGKLSQCRRIMIPWKWNRHHCNPLTSADILVQPTWPQVLLKQFFSPTSVSYSHDAPKTAQIKAKKHHSNLVGATRAASLCSSITWLAMVTFGARFLEKMPPVSQITWYHQKRDIFQITWHERVTIISNVTVPFLALHLPAFFLFAPFVANKGGSKTGGRDS